MATLRKVTKKSSVIFEGKEFFSKELAPYVGDYIGVFLDTSIEGADVVCLSIDGEFITNAQNPERWAFMALEKGSLKPRKEVVEIVQKSLQLIRGPKVSKVVAEEIAIAYGLITPRCTRKQSKTQVNSSNFGFKEDSVVIGKF